ncbi:MAG: (Fe-S)-binding protein [Promethearchaeota archaeon]|nr:MAG: (Fe-S)-binding protein [Candidatus Lokiarchaeota archaeon]
MSEGKDKLKHLSKLKDAALSCVHCGQCRVANWPEKNFYYVCPVYKTEMTPNFEPFFARGKNIILKGLLWGDLELSQELSEIIFQCSVCGACEEFCHNAFNKNIDFANHRWMDTVNVFEALRADLVEAGYALEAHVPMNKALVELLNPYQRDNKQKEEWTKKLDFEIKDAGKKEVEILYFVGCTAALTPQIQRVAIATAKIFNLLGVDFGVLGENEICCGSVALRTGDKKAFQKVAEENVKLFQDRGITKIVTSCAGCYRTLKKDYGDLLEGIEILHTVEFLEELMDKKDISLKKLKYRSTYHDPCHLGRHMGVYEAPRDILGKISEISEMQTNREAAMCCGAGGGLRKGFPELSLEMSKNRVKEAENLGVELLVSTCPFCFRNLSDAIEELNSDLKMVDLVELFLESIQEE